MEITIEQKCQAVADGFDWYRKSAETYITEGNWSEGRVLFVEERYAILERVQAGLAGGGYKLSIPLPARDPKAPSSWYIALSVPVTGFRCTEYLHLLRLEGYENNLLLYRTKDKHRALEPKTTVKGLVRVRDEKVKFGGVDLPVASKVELV